MTSIFEGRGPPKTRPKLQSKQGSFGFQVVNNHGDPKSPIPGVGLDPFQMAVHFMAYKCG